MPAEAPGGAPVLWITERYPPGTGGMAVSCARQVAGLRRAGVPLDVLALRGPAAELDVEVRHREGGTDTLVSRAVSRGYLAQKLWQLVQERHAARPYGAVVGFGAAFAGYLAVTFAAWLGRGAAVLVRGNDLDRDWFDPRRAPLVQEALGRARVVGAVARDKAAQVRGLYPDADVRFTPNAVDPAEWELLPGDAERRDVLRAKLAREGRVVVGLFGELKAKKRVPFWLGALRHAGLKDRVALLVVGRADEATEAILADPALAPPVHRVPFVPRAELAGLYAACDLVAQPSMYEGMPNVVLEAMACGVPVLATRVGGMADVIRDRETGFLFPPEDEAAAAAAAEEALGLGAEARAAMGARAREAVAEDFGPARELEVLRDLLRDLA